MSVYIKRKYKQLNNSDALQHMTAENILKCAMRWEGEAYRSINVRVNIGTLVRDDWRRWVRKTGIQLFYYIKSLFEKRGRRESLKSETCEQGKAETKEN